MLTVRELVPSDRDAVLRINAASRPGVAALDDPELARLMALRGHHLVAERDGHVAGYALTFLREALYDGEEFELFRRRLSRPFLYVDQVATRSESRRGGVGSALYAALEEAARRAGSSALCCEVNLDPPNPESMAFHRARGFHSEWELATRDGRTVAMMIKELR